MNKKLDIHNFWRSNIFIILMFAVISILSGAFLLRSNFLIVLPDLSFHAQRIDDLRSSIINGNIYPTVALNRFNQTGSAVMAMYPKINLYPIVLMSFFIKSFVTLIHVTFILRNFLGLVLTYYSCYFYTKNKNVSMVFSVVYAISLIVLGNVITGFDLGVSSSTLFLPLVLFGSLDLLTRNNWIELTIGISTIVLCHVLNTIIVLIYLFFFFVINIRKFQQINTRKSLYKFILCTTLITSFFWIPFIILFVNNKISSPIATLPLTGEAFNDMIITPFNGAEGAFLSLFAVLGLVVGIIYYKKMSKYSKQLFWISIIVLIISSQLFPWSMLDHTFIKNTFQTPARLYIIPQLLLSYIFSENIYRIHFINKKRTFTTFFVIFIAVIFQVSKQEQIVNNNKPTIGMKSDYSKDIGFDLISKYGYKNLINSNRAGVIDYFPKESVSLDNEIRFHHATYDNGSNYIQMKALRNGIFTFNSNKKIFNFVLPFLYYKGIDYQVKLDGKDVKGYPNKNSLMTINNIHKGKHRVQIIVHKTKAEIVSYILSLTGLLILIGSILRRHKNNR